MKTFWKVIQLSFSLFSSSLREGKLKDDKDFISFSFLSSSLLGLLGGKVKLEINFASFDSKSDTTFGWAVGGKEK